VEGVAGPETANNAAAQTSFIPLLTLGIPSNATMAVIAGALMIQGIAPGPQVMTKQPELFWGLVVSMLIGNIILVIINLPLIGIWVRLLSVPYRLLFPMIVLFCCLGIYSASNSPFEIMLLFVMTCLGYVFNKAGCESAPFVLGFVLGPLMEENFRRTMAITRGDLLVFVERPICLIVIIISIVIVAAAIISPMRRKSLAEVSDEAA
jgi:TctA family transporter